MKLDIIYCEKTQTLDLPQADLVGIQWEKDFGINTAVPSVMGGAPVTAEKSEHTMPDGSQLTLMLYTLEGCASVLSLKPYKNLVFAEVSRGQVALRITV